MLRHPNVITIHDFGETDDAHAPAYIVMEFVGERRCASCCEARTIFRSSVACA